MQSVKSSKTEVNLMKAFAGESQARNRYTYFASAAKKEGFVQIESIFTETANQEKEHAKRLFKFMSGGEIEIVSSFPCGPIGDTLSNLKAAAAGENHEWEKMYPEFADIAQEEGFQEIALVMRNIAVAEQYHESRFLALAKNIEEGKVFKKDTEVVWRCRNCGCIVRGVAAPGRCPACNHEQAYFELVDTNW